jgi:hypothetical protein
MVYPLVLTARFELALVRGLKPLPLPLGYVSVKKEEGVAALFWGQPANPACLHHSTGKPAKTSQRERMWTTLGILSNVSTSALLACFVISLSFAET